MLRQIKLYTVRKVSPDYFEPDSPPGIVLFYSAVWASHLATIL